MTITDNTIGYQMATKYIDACISFKPDRLKKLMSENVVLGYKSIDYKADEEGREAVMKIFHERFFDVTTDVDVKGIEFTTNGLHPSFKLIERATIVEDSVKKPVQLNDHTQLEISKEGERYRITKVTINVTKRYFATN